MKVYIFAGPTLSAQEGLSELDATFLPPVAQGDLYRAALHKPVAIGIIDGYFERVPAVWHKEILWSMENGIHVYGSASMGALRAVELEAFGMIGVGRIFKDFKDGLLEDDDEVAVAHGSEETGYKSISDPMVNIRYTLSKALQEGIISEAVKARLEKISKDIFYPERSYSAIIEAGTKADLPTNELIAFKSWLNANKVNQKREDALLMLQMMRNHLETNPQPKYVPYKTEWTLWWDHLQRHAGSLNQVSEGALIHHLTANELLEEFRLNIDVFNQVYRKAVIRYLAVRECDRRGWFPSESLIQETADAFRRKHNLLESSDVQLWLKKNELTLENFTQLMKVEASLKLVCSHVQPDIIRTLLDLIQTRLDYSRIVLRAQDKQKLLESRGLANPDINDINISVEFLYEWFFSKQNRTVPENLDDFVQTLGFKNRDTFLRVILREYLYSSHSDSDPLNKEESETYFQD